MTIKIGDIVTPTDEFLEKNEMAPGSWPEYGIVTSRAPAPDNCFVIFFPNEDEDTRLWSWYEGFLRVVG
jgi:hypothetical protein